MYCKKVIHKKMMFAIDFARSMTYFPHVIHIWRSTYQQVCDVKLALIGSKGCDRSGNSSSTIDRIITFFIEPETLFYNSVTVNGIPYLSGR